MVTARSSIREQDKCELRASSIAYCGRVGVVLKILAGSKVRDIEPHLMTVCHICGKIIRKGLNKYTNSTCSD